MSDKSKECPDRCAAARLALPAGHQSLAGCDRWSYRPATLRRNQTCEHAPVGAAIAV